MGPGAGWTFVQGSVKIVQGVFYNLLRSALLVTDDHRVGYVPEISEVTSEVVIGCFTRQASYKQFPERIFLGLTLTETRFSFHSISRGMIVVISWTVFKKEFIVLSYIKSHDNILTYDSNL